MESRWYYILDKNQKKGPFSIQELSENTITHNTKVWYPGLSKWQKASSLPDLQTILDKLPPSTHHKRNIFITGTIAFIAITICIASSTNFISLSGNNAGTVHNSNPGISIGSPALYGRPSHLCKFCRSESNKKF
jgi:hypothetical protein